MPQPKSSSGRRKSDAAEQHEGSTRGLSNVRDLLARGAMIPVERLQEALDDAVQRGRMTSDDAEALLQSLVAAGRRQTDDLRSDVEQLIERSRDVATDAGRRARERTTQGTNRVLREMDRARRVAGLGSAFPITGYDDLRADEITSRLDELSAPELRRVRDYERRHGNRKTVLSAVERRLS